MEHFRLQIMCQLRQTNKHTNQKHTPLILRTQSIACHTLNTLHHYTLDFSDVHYTMMKFCVSHKS